MTGTNLSKTWQNKTWLERLPICFCGKKLSRMDAKFCKIHYAIELMSGNKNPSWKGNKVSYTSLHTWIRRELGKLEKCEHCKRDGLTGHQIHWANISGKYLREASDWIRLCVKCHKLYDSKKLKK